MSEPKPAPQANLWQTLVALAASVGVMMTLDGLERSFVPRTELTHWLALAGEVLAATTVYTAVTRFLNKDRG